MRYHGRHERRLHRWGRLVLRVVLIAALAVIIAYPFVEARTIRVDRVTLESAELSPRDLKTLKELKDECSCES